MMNKQIITYIVCREHGKQIAVGQFNDCLICANERERLALIPRREDADYGCC